MARHNAKGRSKGGPPFVMMRWDVLDSPAWMGINAPARAVYIQIARRYGGSNNGFLGASVDVLANECHLAPNTVTRALKRLMEVRLIERTKDASFGYKVRHAAEYRLCCLKCDKTGLPASNDFKRYASA